MNEFFICTFPLKTLNNTTFPRSIIPSNSFVGYLNFCQSQIQVLFLSLAFISTSLFEVSARNLYSLPLTFLPLVIL